MSVEAERPGDEPLDNKKMKIVVEVERIFDPKRKKNNLMMTMAAVTMENDEGVSGEVLHGIPAHTVIRDMKTKEDWVLNYGVLFNSYMEAREKLEADENLETREGSADEFGGDRLTDDYSGKDDGVIFDESGFSSGAGISKNAMTKDLDEDLEGL